MQQSSKAISISQDPGCRPDLNEIQRVCKQLCSHDKNVWLASSHIVAAIQCCPLLAGPAADRIEDGPRCSCDKHLRQDQDQEYASTQCVRVRECVCMSCTLTTVLSSTAHMWNVLSDVDAVDMKLDSVHIAS